MKRFWAETCMVVFLFTCSSGTVMAQHNVVLTWTAPTSSPSGAYINIYRGITAGGESTTPINSTGIKVTVNTYTDSAVTANTKYFYTAKQCATDLSSGTEVCSPPTNEATATVPLLSTDLPTIVGLGAVGK